MPTEDIPLDMPPEYHQQILSLLVPSASPSVVTNLQNATHDAEGNLVFGPAVVNKPWEWIENLGEPAVIDPKEDERGREERAREHPHLKYLVKNSSSISLDHFGTRHTGDGRKQSMQDDAAGQLEGCLRFFEDSVSENIYIRDWRETRRSEPSPALPGRIRAEPDAEMAHAAEPSKAQMQRASPTLSIVSHSSTQGTSSSLRQQHHQSPNSRHSVSTYEVIDVDSLPGTASSVRGKESMKRKAGTISDDDEVEIIEGPVNIRSTHVAKKPKAAKAPASTKGKARKK